MVVISLELCLVRGHMLNNITFYQILAGYLFNQLFVMQIELVCMPTVGNYHNIAVKLYSTCTWWVWHSGIYVHTYVWKTEKKLFLWHGKMQPKKVNYAASSTFPGPGHREQGNPSERSEPWQPHPHATPFYTVECTCNSLTNYIFTIHFSGQSQRAGLLRAALSLSR